MEAHTELYISPEIVEVWLKDKDYKVLAYSFLDRPIYTVQWGCGTTKVLIWSQMHGNESTGLRAMMQLGDMWSKSPKDHPFLQEFTIVYIPQLNPDGASAWTRENAQGIDLNRDLRSLHSPEMRAFIHLIEELSPSYALNLHDQRSTFSVGGSSEGAALALAIPQCDPGKNWGNEHFNNRRKIRYAILQMLTKGNVSRSTTTYFDESYYPTAVGEFVQELGVATLLVESGQFKDDWSRRKSVLSTAEFINNYLLELSNVESALADWKDNLSLDTPQVWGLEPNTPGMCDVLLRNARIRTFQKEWKVDVAINFIGKYDSGHFRLQPVLEELGDLSRRKGRTEYERISVDWDVVEKPYQKGMEVPFWKQIEAYCG